MTSKKYDPFTHIYEVGDLIVYKGAFLDDEDEVGVITAIISLLHDSIDIIYEIQVPSGTDIVTQYDAQFILEPLDIYANRVERRKKWLTE